ncbi:hypothetical protein M1D47_12425 [Bacillus sp. R1-10]
MTSKGIFQTIGTVSSLILTFITLSFTRNFQEIDFLNLTDILGQYTQFILMALTIGIMMVTGFSYLDSRFEHDGFTRFLYLCLGLAHNILAPISFTIAVLKVEFGQYWFAIIIGAIIFMYLSNQQKESHN